MEFTFQRETIKKQNAIANKISIDCGKYYKGKRVNLVRGASPASQEAYPP